MESIIELTWTNLHMPADNAKIDIKSILSDAKNNSVMSKIIT